MKAAKLPMRDMFGIMLSLVNIALLSRLYARWEGWKDLDASQNAGKIRKPHALPDVTQTLVPSREYTAINSNMLEANLPTSEIDHSPGVHVSDVVARARELDSRLSPVARTQQAPLAAVRNGGVEAVHSCSTNYYEPPEHSLTPDPRLSFGSLLDSFDAFMEAWASNAASSVPFFLWSCMELCPYQVPVHPLKATQLLAHRSYSIDPGSWRSASIETAAHDDPSRLYTKQDREWWHAVRDAAGSGALWESMADTADTNLLVREVFGVDTQNSGRLLLGMALAIVFAVAWYLARSRSSLGLDRGQVYTVDYACQVGHGAVDSSNIFAATRLSAPQAAAYAMKSARDAVTTVIERVSSGAGAWKRNGGRLQRAAQENMYSAHPREESDDEESPKVRGALLGDADTRDNGVCGMRRMAKDPSLDGAGGRQHGNLPLCMYNTMNADRTDTAIDTVMDHDTQLQGGFSDGQPVWHKGRGHHHAVGY